MWKVPDKYTAHCYSTDTGELIEDMQLEAIDDAEAESRAYLNCVLHNNKNRNIRVEIEHDWH